MTENNQNQSLTHITFSLIFLGTTIAIIYFTDPNASLLYVFLFFASLAGLCLNFFMFILEHLVYRQRGHQLAAVPAGNTHSKIAARQALLLTFLACGLLFLSSQQLLYWWLAGIFIITLVFIEGFFLVN